MLNFQISYHMTVGRQSLKLQVNQNRQRNTCSRPRSSMSMLPCSCLVNCSSVFINSWAGWLAADMINLIFKITNYYGTLANYYIILANYYLIFTNYYIILMESVWSRWTKYCSLLSHKIFTKTILRERWLPR